MQLIISAGIILSIVAWGILAPASLGAISDRLLAATTISVFGGKALHLAERLPAHDEGSKVS